MDKDSSTDKLAQEIFDKVRKESNFKEHNHFGRWYHKEFVLACIKEVINNSKINTNDNKNSN